MMGARILNGLTKAQRLEIATLERRYGSAVVLGPGPTRDSACRYLRCHHGPRVAVVQSGKILNAIAPDGVITASSEDE